MAELQTEDGNKIRVVDNKGTVHALAKYGGSIGICAYTGHGSYGKTEVKGYIRGNEFMEREDSCGHCKNTLIRDYPEIANDSGKEEYRLQMETNEAKDFVLSLSSVELLKEPVEENNLVFHVLAHPKYIDVINNSSYLLYSSKQ